MPIKPENRVRYPKDWKQIRARILERSDHRCDCDCDCDCGHDADGHNGDCDVCLSCRISEVVSL